MAKDFFISYTSADRRWAEWIAWQLEEAGYTTVIQAWDFEAGQNFLGHMDRALRDCERTIAVLSPSYLAAIYTQSEWTAALAPDPRGEKGTVLPIRVQEFDLRGLLAPLVYIDLVGGDEQGAKDLLLAGVRSERAKPTTPPSFPGAVPRSVSERPRFPGALPPIWNIRHSRNPNFTGREALLADLRTKLTSGQPAALSQAISGLGGVGKTQLAVEYAYRHGADYSLVWWIPAEEPATLVTEYAALAEPLNLPEKGAREQSVAVEAVRHWLARNTGWLLVFDNAREPAALRNYLPRGATGHVLVTCRNPNWGSTASPLDVAEMERDEAVSFLLKRTRQADRPAATVLAEVLGDLPLAMEQAGAFVEATGTALADYLELFRSRRSELWGEEQPPPDYHDTVATTWNLAMKEVRKQSPASASLLNLYAYLGPDDIPQVLLSAGRSHLPEILSDTVADTLAMHRAIAALRRYSLVEAAGRTLSVHRLVQAVARDQLTEDERKKWAEAAVQVLNDAFPSDGDDVRAWPICARLLPHALTATVHAEALQLASEETARLLNQTGIYLQARAEYAEAEPLYRRALGIREKVLGPEHPEMAQSLHNLGGLYHAQGRYGEAEPLLQRALRISERVHGLEHLNVAMSLNNLALLYHALGRYGEAEPLFLGSLRISERTLGPDHPHVTTGLNNPALLYHAQGRYAEAEPSSSVH